MKKRRMKGRRKRTSGKDTERKVRMHTCVVRNKKSNTPVSSSELNLRR